SGFSPFEASLPQEGNEMNDAHKPTGKKTEQVPSDDTGGLEVSHMPQAQETLWTIDEFSAWMKITPMATRAMLRRHNLPANAIVKVGRRVRIIARIVQEWVLKRNSA